MKVLCGLAAALLVISACKKSSESLGSDKEIVVFADSLEYEQIHDELSAAFEKEIPTPWPEKVFELHRKPPGELGLYTHKPRILIVGALDRGNAATQRITATLNPDQQERVRNHESYVFKNDDPWKSNQRLLILTSANLDTLRQRISAHGEELFELFHQPLVERVTAQMFSLYEQKELEKTLLKNYGWALRVQHDYKLYKDFPEERFVMLRRIAPERWLFVNWKKADSPELSVEQAVAWRNEVGQKFYDQDRVAEHELSWHWDNFAGRRALTLQGLWENDNKSAGGPFKSWIFYDEVTGMHYYVDIAVFAPGIDKVPFLRQLEIIASSFYTQHDRGISEQMSSN